MARLLRMPEVAANTLEATLSEWLLAEQAEFADGDAIATVETDKAAVEVPVEGAGVLVRTLVGPGTTVAVGAPVALIAAPGETVAPAWTLATRTLPFPASVLPVFTLNVESDTVPSICSVPPSMMVAP